MPKPVCPNCQCFYRPKTNGFAFIEGMPNGTGVPRGKREPENWRPYKLWNGDLWECPDCGAQVIVGCGLQPVAEHYQDHFAQAVSDWGATLQVNDC
jgi:hypothetical protein